MDLYKSGRQLISNMWSPPAIKYHGLENQGSTCYLNSVLQVLFMTKDFREAVEGYTSANPDTEHIDLQLESVFGDLKSYPAYTHKITKKLGITNVYEQQDAAEYFEKILAKTTDDASKIFHGQLTHKTTCSSCGTETDAAGPFWHLPLALEDSYCLNYCVVNGIEKYFRESSLNGENQMYCEKCDDKSDATTKCAIKHHPEVLMLLLKRFEFDYRSMRYVKINCTVDVPCTLQIPENQPYELYAMVEHSGDLGSGHYIATIKSEYDGRWYSFNDSCVTLLHSQPFQSDKVEKSSSAYLLFYRKEKVPATGTQVFREESTPGGSPLSTCETQDQSEKRKRKREGEEDKGTAEEGNDTAATALSDRDEETGFKETDRVASIKPGLSPDISNVESNEKGNDLHAGKQRDEVKVNIDDEDDMRRNEDTRKSSERPEESVEGQHKDSVGVGDVGHGYNPGVSDRHLKKLDESNDVEGNEERNDVNAEKPRDEVKVNTDDDEEETKRNSGRKESGGERRAEHGHLKKQDESRDAQRRERDVKTDKSGGEEQSEQSGPSLTKHLYMDTEHHGYEGLRNVKHDNLEGQQEMQQANGPDVEQQGDGLKAEQDVEVDEEGKTDPSPLIEDRRVDGRKQNMSEDHQGIEARRRREDRRDVEGAKEQKRGDDKHVQRTETSMTEDQDRRGLDGVIQQKTSVPYLTPEDVDEERHVKTDKSGGDEQSEQSGTSLTKKLYRDTEHHGNEGLGNVKHDNLEGQQKMQQANGPDVEQQGDGSRREQDVEVDKEVKTDPFPLIKDRRVDGRKQNMSKDHQGFEARRRSRDRRQPREDRRDIEGPKEQKRGDDKHAQRTETSMTEDQDRRGLDGVRQQRTSVPHVTPEDLDEERPAKEQERKPFPNRGDSSRKQLIVKTVEEETRKTRFGTQRSIETKIIGIKTREKPAQQERLNQGPRDTKEMSQPVQSIQMQKKKARVSGTQEQAAENQPFIEKIGEEESQSRGDYAEQKKNRKGKKKKTTSCWKQCKPANKTSESD